jgi:hypothetical protein
MMGGINHSLGLSLDNMTPEQRYAAQLAEGEQLLDLGCRLFPTATMFLLRAQFYFFYMPENKVIGMSALGRADDRDPSLDEMFSIYYFRRLHEESFSAEGGNRDIIAYIEFNKYSTDAKKWDEAATRCQLAFWDTLLEPQPVFHCSTSLLKLFYSCVFLNQLFTNESGFDQAFQSFWANQCRSFKRTGCFSQIASTALVPFS